MKCRSMPSYIPIDKRYGIVRVMPKRSRKPTDPNALAASIVQEATKPSETKNPAAVALGRLGGLKGGKARAAKLSAKKRSEIARHAAFVRYHKKP